MNRSILQLAVIGLLGAAPSVADAAWGVLSGTVRFHNRNGSYCPNSADCTGATYRQNQFNVLVGIPEVKVRVIGLNGSIIGQTVTDKSGNYTVFWYSGAQAPYGYLQVAYEHKDGRFRFLNTNGSAARNTSSLRYLFHGTSYSSPQQLSWYWGTASSPSPFANAYWAAWKLWDHRLRFSNRMKSRFDDIDIYGFSSTQPCSGGSCANCGTSCARGRFEQGGEPAWANQRQTVVLDANAAYRPQERVMHELGHIADYTSRKYLLGTGTNYDGTSGWGFTTSEFRATALHEGLASFIAASGLYHDYATDPRTCMDSQGHCYNGSNQRIEDSSLGSCVSEEGRRAISHTRFFWDIYDEVNDGWDTIDLSLYNIFDSIGAQPCPNWPACYGAGQAHDPFNNVASDLSSWGVSCPDCGNAWAFRQNMLNEYSGGYNVDSEYFNNCLGFF